MSTIPPSVTITILSAIVVCHAGPLAAQQETGLPLLQLPDKKIEEVYRANWINTLQPCTENLMPADVASSHSEAARPWKVDVSGHYPGWYPGVDVKHQAAAYLACGRDLPLVLRAWELTTDRYMLEDGGIKPATMHNNSQGVWPETTVDGSVVYYPLRAVATIDYLILGDMIFRYSQDRDWLARNLPAMRRARDFLAGWIDDEGLLLSYSYDLDQVYRDIDGVAQASAYYSLEKLAALENLIGNAAEQQKSKALARRLKEGSNTHFWDAERGYYAEHIAYSNAARRDRLGSVLAVSSQRSPEFSAEKALDGIVGIGVDAFGVGIGEAGKHEWSANHETAGAWIQVGLKRPTSISRAILVNRTDQQLQDGERFAKGYLEFSDGSPNVDVTFTSLGVSRAFVSFSPRTVTWVKFVGTEMQGKGGQHGGLAEFALVPADQPYLKFNHGMTDTNFAMVAFGVADEVRASRIWDYFREHESSFYEVNGLFAPTWIAERAETYGKGELNKRAPYKDCVAIARIWRYDALMRRRMNDGEGIQRTLGYANVLFDRPSGGGVGWFAERYGLGRFQKGDEAQATIPQYAGYPAIYNSFIVQEAMLGLSADVNGVIHIAPCVPTNWYDIGFGQEGCGVRHDHHVGFTYSRDRFEGHLSGPAGPRTLSVQFPPGLATESGTLLIDGRPARLETAGRQATFTVELPDEGRVEFSLVAGRQ